jgi:hypothetical protein
MSGPIWAVCTNLWRCGEDNTRTQETEHRNRITKEDKFVSLGAKLATDPEVRVRFPALPDVLRSSGSGTGSTRPREHN